MPMSWIDVTGYAAALAVLVAFCMTGLIPLRVLAIVSNILFAAYGILAHLYPVFLLHMVLLPINLGKLAGVAGGARGTGPKCRGCWDIPAPAAASQVYAAGAIASSRTV